MLQTISWTRRFGLMAVVVMLLGAAIEATADKGLLVPVPDVVGMTWSAAAAEISGGLSTGTVTKQYSDTMAAGLVLAQDPVAGTMLQILSGKVNLVISRGAGPVPGIFINQDYSATNNPVVTLEVTWPTDMPARVVRMRFSDDEGDMVRLGAPRGHPFPRAARRRRL